MLDPVAIAVAAHRLAGAVAPGIDRPLDGSAWRRLETTVRRQRLTGLLVAAIEDGALPATSEQRAAAVADHRAAVVADLHLERLLLHVADALDLADIEFRVLKGAAVAHLDYAEPTLRSFGDVDVLVRGDDFDAAVQALARAGIHRKVAEFRPHFDARYGKGATLVDDAGLEVDLHRTFVAGPFGMTIELDQLFRTATTFTVAGRDLPALGHEERLLHACYHAAIGRGFPRLVPLRDVAEILLGGRADEDGVLSVASAWRGRAVAARAITTTWTTLELADATPLTTWATRYEPAEDEARMLVGYTGTRWSYGAQAIAALRVIPGVRAKAAYVRALTLPRRRALDERGDSPVHRWRRGMRLLAQEWRER